MTMFEQYEVASAMHEMSRCEGVVMSRGVPDPDSKVNHALWWYWMIDQFAGAFTLQWRINDVPGAGCKHFVQVGPCFKFGARPERAMMLVCARCLEAAGVEPAAYQSAHDIRKKLRSEGVEREAGGVTEIHREMFSEAFKDGFPRKATAPC